ncbi:S-adenosylmethionine:tRNA ribosyltransferase-isomerase [Marivirga atlantica]|uniref:S-adenosylmethionine:tRNA ribosyltransferase-isomerase n=1 Tax=Marivirga atlantica TaxID=1548457 RepID=A0A937AIV6_9BACT|nr:S-adenosylmethionine:tRNA ribosyltransferase-isomerase [Marivirga atlantica]MBL0766988.1 S-adenosylmethionine:tRNA ribosyltransferase-isomerase [Marivirga atlantica]
MSKIEEIANNIKLDAYRYELPDSKIAKYPLANRSASKLLVYNKGEIANRHFYNIGEHLPSDSTLVFNNTKVIPARLQFQKDTGASIEIFLLSPVKPYKEVTQAMSVTGSTSWQCMIGNRKRWKDGTSLSRFFETEKGKVKVTASYDDYDQNLIAFNWDLPELAFVEIVELMGTTPLPPYLNRKAEESDKPRYQTVYSEKDGAVAAPTAGLHFTDEILSELKSAGHAMKYLTLHVGAGTFQPIKEDNVLKHPMHNEQIQIELETIEFLAESTKQIVAVGTTSVRSLESAYWFGVQLLNGINSEFRIGKLVPYEIGFDNLPNRNESFKAILNYMRKNDLTTLYGDTEIFIFPGYKFQVVDGLITNFHQPESTLILLIASFLGDDWKKVYQEALNNEYRFLSYGDSSLLIP